MRKKILEALIKKYKDENGIRGLLKGAILDIVIGFVAFLFVCILRIFLF